MRVAAVLQSGRWFGIGRGDERCYSNRFRKCGLPPPHLPYRVRRARWRVVRIRIRGATYASPEAKSLLRATAARTDAKFQLLSCQVPYAVRRPSNPSPVDYWSLGGERAALPTAGSCPNTRIRESVALLLGAPTRQNGQSSPPEPALVVHRAAIARERHNQGSRSCPQTTFLLTAIIMV